ISSLPESINFVANSSNIDGASRWAARTVGLPVTTRCLLETIPTPARRVSKAYSLLAQRASEPHPDLRSENAPSVRLLLTHWTDRSCILERVWPRNTHHCSRKGNSPAQRPTVAEGNSPVRTAAQRPWRGIHFDCCDRRKW